MSGVRDMVVWEFDVKYTSYYYPRNEHDETGPIPVIETIEKTLRLVADKWDERTAEAWVHDTVNYGRKNDKISPDLKILDMRTVKIDGILQKHIY